MLGQLWKIKNLAGLFLVISLVGCQLSIPEKSLEQIPDLAFTQAAQTIIAELTQNAPQETQQLVSPTLNELSLLASMTAEATLPSTSTPVPTEIPLPTDTEEAPTIAVPPTNTPAPTALPKPEFVVAFQDDFSSGILWPTQKEGNVHLEYDANGYNISNYLDKEIAWSVRGEQYADVMVEVVASRVSGAMDGYYGIICQFSDVSHYYLLAVGGDGWYGIGLKQPGKLVFLDEGNNTEAIYTGNAPNLIRADCLRGELTLWANGTELTRVEDHSYNAGAVGMAVGTRSEQEFVVVFDDFAVYVPE